MPSPYGVTLFCDDIRHEVGGKVTLVGIYGPELIILGEGPITMPILALSLRLYIPRDLKFKKSNIVVSLQSGDQTKTLAQLETPIKPNGEWPENMMAMFNGNISFSPFVATPEDIIRVRAYFDDLEVKMGALKIASSPNTQSTPNKQASVKSTQ